MNLVPWFFEHFKQAHEAGEHTQLRQLFAITTVLSDVYPDTEALWAEDEFQAGFVAQPFPVPPPPPLGAVGAISLLLRNPLPPLFLLEGVDA